MASGAAGVLDVWRVDLRRSKEWVDEARESLLLPAEVARRRREIEEAWERRIVARAALRVALSRRLEREPRAFRLEVDSGGKPRLARADDRPDAQFNISHSGSICVIAIDDRRPVGVDVEVVRERTHMERVIGTRFAPEEAAEILRLEGDERRIAFYRVWTRKEAFLKASGVGLAVELDSFAVSAGEAPILISEPGGREANWTLADLDLGAGLQGALAIGGKTTGLPSSIEPAELPM